MSVLEFIGTDAEGEGEGVRARLSQEWAQGLMCTGPILNRLKNLNIFDELKYVMGTYKSVLIAMYYLRVFILSLRKYFSYGFYCFYKEKL